MKFSLRIPFLLAAIATDSTCYAAIRKILVGNTSGQLMTMNFDPAAGTITPSSSIYVGPNPTWQTYYKPPYSGKRYILSVNEVYDNQNDALRVYEVNGSGGLIYKSQTGLGSVWMGPVSIAASKSGLLVSASYGGGVAAFSLNPGTGLISSTPLDSFTYTLPAPKPHPRQDGAHPHQAILDPTEKFALVPDLGADLTRLYSVDSSPAGITELTPLSTAQGAGPRHGAFSPAGGHYYQINELSNSIDVFKVTYTPTITFNPVQNISLYATGTAPALDPTPTGGEIAVSPDGKFVYASNRSDKTYPSARVAPSPSTQTIQSDSFAIYSVDASTGKLTFITHSPVGGITPRHFSLETLNGGEYVAVATQTSNRVTIYKRDKTTGLLGTVPVAGVDISTFGATGPVVVTWLD